MIKQEFTIKRYFWKVYVYYDVTVDDRQTILNKLIDINLPHRYITSAYTMLEENTLNSGFTYTNLREKSTIIAITKTSNANQFINSFTHEIYHLVNHIARKYNINFDSEEVCYLYGHIAQTMFNCCHHLLCDNCRDT